MTVAPYPLCWPTGVPRTPANKRITSTPFRTDFDRAVRNVADSLRKFQADAGVKITDVILSTNVDLLNRHPTDPGACAWFKMDDQFVAFGVDRFAKVEANIQAIHHIIEARRTELKYGGLAIVRQTFRAFLALPGAAPEKPWWEILGIPENASAERIEDAYRDLAKRHHPDVGGSADMMAKINIARQQALGSR